MGLFKKKISQNFIFIIIIFTVFITDRISKILVIDYFLSHNIDNYYVNSFLNFILTWNIGLAFGILKLDNSFYHLLSFLIFIIICILLYLLIVSSSFIEKNIMSLIIGGALGNFYDRLIFNAVPDFIDIHYKDFHWFTFNVADIIITLGIILLLLKDFFSKKNV